MQNVMVENAVCSAHNIHSREGLALFSYQIMMVLLTDVSKTPFA
jgi:hypothetical protein